MVNQRRSPTLLLWKGDEKSAGYYEEKLYVGELEISNSYKRVKQKISDDG